MSTASKSEYTEPISVAKRERFTNSRNFDQIGGSTTAGSTKGDTGQSGKEDSRSRWREVHQIPSATSPGRASPPEKLETEQDQSRPQSLDTKTGKT